MTGFETVLGSASQRMTLRRLNQIRFGSRPKAALGNFVAGAWRIEAHSGWPPEPTRA